MKVNQRRIRAYFNRYCKPQSDEKKLQEAFHSEHLYFRFDVLKKNYQVWEENPLSGFLRCVLSLDTPNVNKFIYLLRERQKSTRQLQEMFDNQLERNRMDYELKRDALAEETASEVMKAAKGKVTSSGSTYIKTEL